MWAQGSKSRPSRSPAPASHRLHRPLYPLHEVTWPRSGAPVPGSRQRRPSPDSRTRQILGPLGPPTQPAEWNRPPWLRRTHRNGAARRAIEPASVLARWSNSADRPVRLDASLPAGNQPRFRRLRLRVTATRIVTGGPSRRSKRPVRGRITAHVRAGTARRGAALPRVHQPRPRGAAAAERSAHRAGSSPTTASR